jgi:hypothetical protein
MPFGDQVETVAQDLKAHFWHPQARVVANSFGAYLFLHPHAHMEAFPGRVLLLSPIIGSSELSHERAQLFSPPRSELLMELAKAGRLAKPKHCEIHVGAEDWQSVPTNLVALGELTRIHVTIIPGLGHTLDQRHVIDYIIPALSD